MRITLSTTDESLINAYHGLAEIWRMKADIAMDNNDAWEVYNAIKNQMACEAKARAILNRYRNVEG